ncbi:hypothetical protein N7532_001580 [Penicillium argentinense]|uniref:Uncharacterized protein n=1 Tax=Penicillium argentinense TaxID=1131581 RepID=A0A9W9KLW6_9EURO|nr:uncharacterized protein N7532_001580 [Penicillium argentinense]KAJ5111045.1 hypothetical protein N7532_001580 [Penicillium argentinense]
MSKRALRIARNIAIPTLAATYATHLGLKHLEEKYPALPPAAAGSKALSTPSLPSQRCAYTDIYSARIPLAALSSRIPEHARCRRYALDEAWAQALLSSKVLRSEASLYGLFTKGSYEPGDVGANGFGIHWKTGARRKLLNGLFSVEAEPAQNEGYGLLISWSMADAPRVFFERIARWGYPWRLMSGGRHEMSVSEPFEVKGEGRFVEVRFSAAHDYEVVPGEGNNQKILPEWSNRLHRGFARFILDCAVREVVREFEGPQ